MGRLIITTVGTSLGGIDNLVEGIKEKIKFLADSEFKSEQIEKKVWKHFDKTFLACIEHLNTHKNNIDFSAEIASLEAMKVTKDDEVLLLYSDTPDGAFCALVNETYINQTMKIPCTKQKIKDLEAKEPGKFSKGISELIKILFESLIISKKRGKDLVFNITGGYKGVIPFITLFAIREGKSIYYLYQTSELNEFTSDWVVKSFDEGGNVANTNYDPQKLKPQR